MCLSYLYPWVHFLNKYCWVGKRWLGMESYSGKEKVCLMVYCLISEEKYSQGYVIDVGQNLRQRQRKLLIYINFSFDFLRQRWFLKWRHFWRKISVKMEPSILKSGSTSICEAVKTFSSFFWKYLSGSNNCRLASLLT